MPAPPAPFTLDWFGDRFLRIELPPDAPASQRAPDAINGARERLLNARIDGLIDITPAARSALLTFDLSRLRAPDVERLVSEALRAPRARTSASESRLVEIPVCYEPDFAPDSAALAAELGIASHDVAAIHTGVEYRVEFLGFMPGFAYIGGLPAPLHAPRLPRPRTRVPAGSVGVAGDKTGVYPAASPGGWRLIGRTPLRMFDASRPNPSLLLAGDRVRFRAISAAEFAALAEGRS